MSEPQKHILILKSFFIGAFVGAAMFVFFSVALAQGVSELAGVAPQIIRVYPQSGGAGQFLTLEGTSFGFTQGEVTFVRDSESLAADVDFIQECKNTWWRDSAIIVKVPSRAVQGNYTIKVRNSAGAVSNVIPFTVSRAAPNPGICGLVPDNGPAGTEIKVFGHGFGSQKGRLVVGNEEITVTDGDWGTGRISARMPSLDITPATVRVVSIDRVLSNPVHITSNARCSSSVNEENQQCCSDGSYRAKGTCEERKSLCKYTWNFSTGELRGVGEACTGSSQCASGACVDGVCDRGTKVVDEACEFDAQCKTGLKCDLGVCSLAAKDIGEKCSRNEECLSNRCDNGVCVAGLNEIGAVCSKNQECKTKNCVNGVCGQSLRCVSVEARDPKGGAPIPRNSVFRVRFNQLIKEDSLRPNVRMQPDIPGALEISSIGTGDLAKTEVVFRPSALLSPKVSYQMTIGQGIQSAWSKETLGKCSLSGTQQCNTKGAVCENKGDICTNGATCIGGTAVCSGKGTVCTGPGSKCLDGALCIGTGSTCIGAETQCTNTGSVCRARAECSGASSKCEGLGTRCVGNGSACKEGAICVGKKPATTPKPAVCDKAKQICSSVGSQCSKTALCTAIDSSCTGAGTVCAGNGSRCIASSTCTGSRAQCSDPGTTCTGSESICTNGARCTGIDSNCSGAGTQCSGSGSSCSGGSTCSGVKSQCSGAGAQCSGAGAQCIQGASCPSRGTPAAGGCQEGQTKCADNVCRVPTNPACSSTPCNKDGNCTTNESCSCDDCFGKQSSCQPGFVCSKTTKLCQATVSAQTLLRANARCDITAPQELVVGTAFSARAVLRNTGSVAWIPSDFSFSSQNPAQNTVWGSNNVPLSSPVQPNASAEITIQAKAPAAPGMYSFSWQLRKGNEWVGEKCLRTIRVVVPPTGATCNNNTRCDVRESCSCNDCSTKQECVPRVGIPPPACRNGILETGEQCDDGDSDNTNACTNSCQPKPNMCGNMVKETGEQCDDGDSDDTNGCKNNCTLPGGATPQCGNGIKEGNEQCDDKNQNNTDSCKSDCTSNQTGCGNAIRSDTEQCDDGDTVNDNGCRNDCTLNIPGGAVCRNGVREDPEQCDDGDIVNTNACRNDCLGNPASCGNGMKESGEQCDDGDRNDNNACTNTCTPRDNQCGNGIQETGEQCDDGDKVGSNQCKNDCTLNRTGPVCGNSAREGAEQCDDGNQDNTDACRADCTGKAGLCGNGMKEAQEQCDDGDSNDENACKNSCQPNSTGCGNAIKQDSEQCDDGDKIDTNQCSNECTETGTTFCGDNMRQEPEQCDDGNQDNTDACRADCKGNSKNPVCGNAALETGEQCDDGDTNDTNECKNSCQPNSTGCGNGIQETGEQCDDGDKITQDSCRNDCTPTVPKPNNARCSLTAPHTILITPAEFSAGHEFSARIKLQNTGTKTWSATSTPQYSIRSESPLDNNFWSKASIPFPIQSTSVSPGGFLDVAISLVAPVVSGEYPLHWQLMDGDSTVGERCMLNVKIVPEFTNNAQCTLSVLPYCGDGVREGQENCDDGDKIDTNACSNSCSIRSSQVPVCGNGVQETGEQCDDGNTKNNDTCRTDCVVNTGFCGNGLRDANEQCDDGNRTDTDGCTNTCTRRNTVCGNGIREIGEQCDDGNANNTDACTSTCVRKAGFCGNGVIESPEQCDDGDRIDINSCANDCTIRAPNAALCGNGEKEDGEQCDDGNAVNNDACRNDCALFTGTCGNGEKEGAEQCDDGDRVDANACTNSCTVRAAPQPFCGNGIQETGEQCDDGNTKNNDTCRADCVVNVGFCGNGLGDGSEQCDDGNSNNTDSCTNQCTPQSAVLVPDKDFTLQFSIKNTGTKTWIPDTHTFALRSSGNARIPELETIPLRAAVSPGDAMNFGIRPYTPRFSGVAPLVLQMREGTSWFGEQCKKSIRLPEPEKETVQPAPRVSPIQKIELYVNANQTATTTDVFTCFQDTGCPDDMDAGAIGNQHTYRLKAYAENGDEISPKNIQWSSDTSSVSILSPTNTSQVKATPKLKNGTSTVSVLVKGFNNEELRGAIIVKNAFEITSTTGTTTTSAITSAAQQKILSISSIRITSNGDILARDAFGCIGNSCADDADASQPGNQHRISAEFFTHDGKTVSFDENLLTWSVNGNTHAVLLSKNTGRTIFATNTAQAGIATISLSIQGSDVTKDIIIENKHPRSECLGARASCIGSPDKQGNPEKLSTVIIEANARPLNPDVFTCFGNACVNDRESKTAGNQRFYTARLHAENNSLFSLDNIEKIEWTLTNTRGNPFVRSEVSSTKGENLILTNTETEGDAVLSVMVTPKTGKGSPVQTSIQIMNLLYQFQVRDILISTNGQFLNQDAFGCMGDTCADDRAPAQAGNQHELMVFVIAPDGRLLAIAPEKIHWSLTGQNGAINLSSATGSTVFATNTEKQGSVVVSARVDGISAVGSLAIENIHPYQNCQNQERTDDYGETILDRVCIGLPVRTGNSQILQTSVIDAIGRPIPVDRYTCKGNTCPEDTVSGSVIGPDTKPGNQHTYQVRLHAQNNSLLSLDKIQRIQWNLSPTQAFDDMQVFGRKNEQVMITNTGTSGTAVLSASIIPSSGAVQTAKLSLVNDVKVTTETSPLISAQCKNNKPDGVKDTGEKCDDGDEDDTDACTNSCEPKTGCGNGIKEAGEYCDDGDRNNDNQCANDCSDTTETSSATTPAQCKNNKPDGVKDTGEKCDDGDEDDTDACTNSCEPKTGCGNGIKEAGEYCDDGDRNNENQCANDCSDCTVKWPQDSSAQSPLSSYQFSISYCLQSKGKRLSELLIVPTQVGERTEPVGSQKPLQEYFYRFGKNGIQDNTNPDVIILKIYENQEFPSPLVWYKNSNISPGEQPAPVLIDGFPSIRDSSGIFVSIPVLKDDGTLEKTYILHFTTNKGASAQTKEVLNALMQKTTFALSITDYMRAGALRRDMQRFADINFIEYILDSYKRRVGCEGDATCYPALSAGSYIKYQSVSGWPSWNIELGKELGASMPLDPMQKVVSSKPFGDCPGGAGYASTTCWNENAKRFYNNYDSVERALSENPLLRAYTYIFTKNIKKYRICSNLEYFATQESAKYCKDSGGGELVLDVSGTQAITSIAGSVLVEFWNDLVGALQELKNAILRVPASFATYFRKFEIEQNTGDNYGTRLRGYISPPDTDAYTFYIASDNDSELYLSDDEKPYTKKLIAKVQGRTGFRQWTAQPNQKSAPKNLQAGARYYIEALHKEKTDSDHVSVAWQKGNGAITVLGSDIISSYTPAPIKCTAPQVDNGSGSCISCPAWWAFDGVSACIECGDFGEPKCEGGASQSSCKGVTLTPSASGTCSCTEWQNRNGNECTACGGAREPKCAIPVENKVCKGNLVPSTQENTKDQCLCSSEWQNRVGDQCTACGGVGEPKCAISVENKVCKGNLVPSIRESTKDQCLCSSEWENRVGDQCTACGGANQTPCRVSVDGKRCKGDLFLYRESRTCQCTVGQNRDGNNCTPCGRAGQPKCTSGTACQNNLSIVRVGDVDRCACDQWQNISQAGCAPCGGVGESRCEVRVNNQVNLVCKGNLSLNTTTGKCACASLWQNVSRNNECTPCGDANQPKCASDPACRGDLLVDSNNKCNCASGNNLSQNNQCIACGGNNQPACGGTTCNSGMLKQNDNTCIADSDGDQTADLYDKCPSAQGPSGPIKNEGCPMPVVNSVSFPSNFDFHFTCNKDGFNCQSAGPVNATLNLDIENAQSVEVYYYGINDAVGTLVQTVQYPPQSSATVPISPVYTISDADRPAQIMLLVKSAGTGMFDPIPIYIPINNLTSQIHSARAETGSANMTNVSLDIRGGNPLKIAVDDNERFLSGGVSPALSINRTSPAWKIVRLYSANENQSSVAVFSDVSDTYENLPLYTYYDSHEVVAPQDTCEYDSSYPWGALNTKYQCPADSLLKTCIDLLNPPIPCTPRGCSVNKFRVTCYDHNPQRPEGY